MTEQNWYEKYNVGAQGSAQKFRGVEVIDRYNYINTGTARSFDFVEYENGQYMNALQFIGAGLPGHGDKSRPSVVRPPRTHCIPIQGRLRGLSVPRLTPQARSWDARLPTTLPTMVEE